MHDLHKFTFSDIFLSYEYSFTFKVIISIQHRCYILYASLFTHQDTSILNNVFLVSMDVTSLCTPGGYSKTFFSWEAPPRGPTPYPYIPFWTEKVCFSNTFYWRMIPRFVYLVSFSRLFRSHKLICKAFWAFAQTKMRDFRTLLYFFNSGDQRTRKFTM